YWAARYARAGGRGRPPAVPALVAEVAAWLEKDWSADSAALSPYTVSERIGSLAECLFWTRCCHLPVPPALIQSIKRRVWRDAHHLQANLEYGLGLHNHILNNARGLFLAGAVLGDCAEA